MNYYIIDWDYDNLDVIGHYPQIEYDKGNNFNSPNNIRKVNPHEFPNFIPEINLKFHNKSKITNFIESPNTKAIYIDENFKEILVNFNLPKFKFHPLNVKFKSETLHYFWFQFLREDFWEYLDKNKSKAVITDNKQNFEVVGEFDLNMAVNEMHTFINTELPYHQNTKWEKLVFKKGFTKYDIYQPKIIDNPIIISERLLNALQDANLTGFKVKPYIEVEFE